MVMSVLAIIFAASAWATDPPLPSPVSNDLCGASKDQVYLADDSDPSSDVGWKDSAGVYYTAGQWNSTSKASSLTLTVEIWSANGLTSYTYPTIAFGVGSDSSCAQALDTVTVSGMTCMSNGGTRATFTYVNTPDNGWPQTFVTMFADRWDSGQLASFNLTNEGVSVAEGKSVSVTGGDTLVIKTERDFYLAPGTYNMWVTTVETGQRKLPNTFFIPACGDYKVPPGDPSGLGGPSGPTPGSAVPKGRLTQVSTTKMKVAAINKGVSRITTFKVVIDPKKGKTTTQTLKLAKGKSLVRSYTAPARTRFVLKARVLVKGTWRMKPVAERALGNS